MFNRVGPIPVRTLVCQGPIVDGTPQKKAFAIKLCKLARLKWSCTKSELFGIQSKVELSNSICQASPLLLKHGDWGAFLIDNNRTFIAEAPEKCLFAFVDP